MLHALSLRVRIFLFFAALAFGSIAALIVALMLGYFHAGNGSGAAGYIQAGLFAAFAILGLLAWIWLLFDAHVAKPIDQLSGALRARAHGKVSDEIGTDIARYLGDLAPAAAAAAQSLGETRSALAEAVARETHRLASEKSRLETLLSDVPLGVLLCGADHQLAFYNGQAMDLLQTTGSPGLDRNLLDFLHDGPILHAYDRLCALGEPEAATDLLCSTKSGAQVLAARMRLLPPSGQTERPGYVLTLRDVTADQNSSAQREALMTEAFQKLRRPIANLSTLLEVLPEGEALPGKAEHAMRQEVSTLAATVTDLIQRNEAAQASVWPLPQTRAADLLDGIAARLRGEGISTQLESAPLMLRCDGFEIVGLVGIIAPMLGVKALEIVLTEDGSMALLRLQWLGSPLTLGHLAKCLAQAINSTTPDVTGQTVLLRHGTDIWPETHADSTTSQNSTDQGADTRQTLCLPLPIARRIPTRPDPMTRAVTYDFDLLSKTRNAKVLDTPLEDLTYVVFDSETTGLRPDLDDRIVQLAALRIVNGRRLQNEVFDCLVNPGRSIPTASTAVHGITDAMVADAPDQIEATRRFHRFAQGAVLVAHNAPFDMAFLRQNAGTGGPAFDNPILDTVLLSAVIFGQHEIHSLDALCHRLGITIPEAARHTALGDTVATADALLKLLPMLKGRGLTTFGAVIAEVKKHSRLLKDLNG